MVRFPSLIAASLLVFAPLASAAPATQAIQDAIAGIDERQPETTALATKIWNWAEVGYQEEQSSALLAAELEAELEDAAVLEEVGFLVFRKNILF